MTMKEHDSKRRTVLIGTLAAGAALMLHGCKGKQEEASVDSEAAPAPQGAAPAAPQGERRMDDEPTPKMSKDGAQYLETAQGDQNCSGCENFIADSKTCKVVEGEVNPKGWCIFWTAA